MIIYRIVNTFNGLSYIGQTIRSLKHRWNEHCASKIKNMYIDNAIKKYGKENFSVEEIAKYDNLEDLNNAEEYYIDFYNCLAPNGYNLLKGGRNKIPSLETRQKMGKARKGIRNGMYGKNHSLESIAKMSASKKGRPSKKKGIPMSEEQKTKLSLACIGRRPSEKTKLKMSETHKKLARENPTASHLFKKGMIPHNKSVKS